MTPSHQYRLSRILSAIILVGAGIVVGVTGCGQSDHGTAPNAGTTLNGNGATAPKPTGDNTPPYPRDLTADGFTRQCDTDLKNARKRLATLEQLPPPYTRENLLVPLDRLYVAINNTTGIAYLLNYVHPQEEVQKAADDCVQAFTKLQTDIGLSTQLYRHLLDIDTDNADPLTQRFRERQLRDFKRAGVNLDPQSREEIRNLNESITALGQEFSKNIRSDAPTLSLDGDDPLAGLPKDYIARHPADDNGVVTISTDYPDLLPFMRYARDDNARKELYKRYLNRAYPANRRVLRAILRQRQQLANLLGYPDYASYATEIMMTRDPDRVAHFIDRVDRLATPRSRRDYTRLLQALQAQYPAAKQVGSWQKTYAEELVRKQDYGIDTKQVRQYFQYKNVKRGIFELTEDLFGIEIKPWKTAVWAEAVEAYEIREQGRVIGRFYLDMHPRPLKYKHAAEFDIHAGVSGLQLPIAALVCNFPGGSDPSALMEHRQVETFLHEFGHLLHHIFSGQQAWGIFSGVATEQDFIEAPSQMLEEWVWDYDTLKRFAVNAEGETIPRELVEKMRKARDFGRGIYIRNQLFYAALSLDYYRTPPQQLDLTQQMIDLQARYSPFPYIADTHFYASFGHLFDYSAAYYTYMWSEVIAADILKPFREQGMRNRALAQKYRSAVLAPGGSRDAAELVSDFLGRPFNFDAFTEQLNKD